MPKPKRPKYRQFDLWGNPIPKVAPKKSGEIAPLEFEGHNVRMIRINNIEWWVALDVCKAISIRNNRDAVNRVPGDEKQDVGIPDAIGRHQPTTVVNEAGLYRLIFMSRKPEAERFKKWVFGEVLPSIRKTGSYSVQPSDRITATQRKLDCDRQTAKARCDQTDRNKESHSRLAKQDAKRKHFREYHNAIYRGEFDGREAGDLRGTLAVTDTPLNHMASIPLSVNTLIKAIGERYIQEHGVPLSEQPEVLERIARETTSESLARLGSDFSVGITEHPKRGRILDVVRVQLTAPGPN